MHSSGVKRPTTWPWLRFLPQRAALVGACAALFWSGSALAEPTTLTAEDIRAQYVGNTMVGRYKGEIVDRFYLGEDGATLYDPIRGFIVRGHWAINSDGQYCQWPANPEKPFCPTIAVENGEYLFDWGLGFDRTLVHTIEQGDTTDPTDNPGEGYHPDPDIPLPDDLSIRSPAQDLSADIADFLGLWFGTWYSNRDFLIAIEAIDSQHAEVVYSWSSTFYRGGTPGWERTRATVENFTLTIKFLSGIKYDLTLNQDGTLKVVGHWAAGDGLARAIRWDDPALLEAPKIAELLLPASDKPRDQLNFVDLQSDGELGEAPIHNDFYTPLGDWGPAQHNFEGTMTIKGSKILGRSVGSRGHKDYGVLPAVSVDFFTEGDRLVPVDRTILSGGEADADWNIILAPGRIWSEVDDQGWSRASFPFLLTEPQSSSGRNGLATFLFNDQEISHLRFQVIKEASPWGHVDLWGTAVLQYEPQDIENRETLAAAFRKEIEDQLVMRPWSDLEAQHGVDTMALFDGEKIRREISTSGLVIDDELYATPCRTRYGLYPFCREMRHGVYSVTKSVVGWLSLLYLAETYGEQVFDLKVADYVDIPARHEGWKNVTFGDALNMVSGIGNVEPQRVDYYVDGYRGLSSRALDRSQTVAGKLKVVGALHNYPWGPGEIFRYGPFDPFVLSVAMDAFLKSQEGPDANLWETMNRDVFQPIGIHYLPTVRTIEDNDHFSVPLADVGLFVTLEEMARIARLIQNNGRAGQLQLLHAEKLRETLEDGCAKGYGTGWWVDDGEAKYFNALWYGPYKAKAGCIVSVPGMSGVGGNYALFMPNGMTALRFAGGPDEGDDEDTYDRTPMLRVADSIRSFCS